MSAKPGDRFRVSEIYEVSDRKGRIISKFLPDFDYRVTPRNLELVNQMVLAGAASIGTALPARPSGGFALGAAPARLKGAVSTGAVTAISPRDVAPVPAAVKASPPRRRATRTNKA